MIKKHHTHIVLLILFFTGLIVLWWADVSEIPTEAERRARRSCVVPDLLNVPIEEIHRVEVDNEHGKFVFERQKEGQWQMRKPIDTAADAGLVGRLVTNLKELRRSPDAGTVKGAPETFGLNPPAATVRVYGYVPEKLVATLDVGKPIPLATGKEAAPGLKDRRYVQPVHGDGKKEGIEVTDGRPLAVVDSDVYGWREKTLFNVPTFAVTALTVAGPGRDLEARRVEGHWALRRPLRAPADDDKVEGTLAELTSLRVAEGNEGFVADDVRDLARYGLDTPRMTVTLKSRLEKEAPMVLEVGKPVPDRVDLYYARRGGQDDVVMIDGKNLRDLGTDPNELRSKRVAEIDPARVTFVEVKALGRDFWLARVPAGWTLVRPAREKVDTASVQNLLLRLGELQALEFLEPSKVADPKLDPPALTLQVWQSATREHAPSEPPSAPNGEPLVPLRIGRHDPLRKTVYARVEGDQTILALPDQFLDVLPKNEFAFRDRTVLALSPAAITHLTLRRDSRTHELVAPESSGNPNEWKMVAPVESSADPEAITQLTTLLSNLMAETYVTDKLGDGKGFGLDRPSITVTWKTRPGATTGDASKSGPEGETGTLRIGSQVPMSESVYANIAGNPMVFTLSPVAIQILRAEFHHHKVLVFPPDQVSRLVLRWPGRTLSFVPKSGRGAPSSWRPEPGQEITGFDLSRLPALVEWLANLKTQEFVQYRGVFPTNFGLDHPRLTIQVQLSGSRGTKELRIGNQSPDGRLYATTATGSAGAAFTLAGPAWVELVRVPKTPLPELPENVFTPKKPGSAQ